MESKFKRLVLPGLVFQSICIAGGYGTGREIAEFFLQYGPVGGLLGLLLPATIVISVGCAIGYELARVTRSYDYRKFLQLLMGRGWVLYEMAYVVTVLLVLAVVSAAIGTLVLENFGIPNVVGSATLLLALLISRFGLIDLVAMGYGTLMWIYMLILVLPLFTIGVWKITKRN